MENKFKVKKGLVVFGSGSEVVDIQGSSGQLFSVSDSLIGVLMSVNDISGLPILEVFSDDTVKLGSFNQEGLIVSGSDVNIADKLIHIGDTDTAIRFPANDVVAVETSGSERLRITSAGNVGIGTTTPATRLDVSGSIRTSTGVLFGTDTASANTLDDYEEGVWTPVYSPASGSFTTLTMDNVGAFYTKIGNMVHCSALIRTSDVDATGASGNLLIGGLPFTAGVNVRAAISIGLSLGWGAGGYPLSGQTSPSSGNILLYKRSAVDGATSNVQVSNMVTGAGANLNYITMAVTYSI